MCLDANLLAHVQDGADGTARQITRADMLPERDEQAVDLDPIALGKLRFERHHRLLRGGGGDISPAIGHTMDVDVYADERLTAGNPQDEMGALGPHTRKGLHNFLITRKLAIEFVHHPQRDLPDLDRLPLVES